MLHLKKGGDPFVKYKNICFKDLHKIIYMAVTAQQLDNKLTAAYEDILTALVTAPGVAEPNYVIKKSTTACWRSQLRHGGTKGNGR